MLALNSGPGFSKISPGVIKGYDYSHCSFDVPRVGADVDVMLEDVSLSGRTQIVMDLDHLVPFPHMKAVSVTFLEK